MKCGLFVCVVSSHAVSVSMYVGRLPVSQSLRLSIIAAAGCAATLAAPVCAQVATFTGGAANDTTNWCNALNWFPAEIPADGSVINVPSGVVANMANCGGTMRILGPINASGTIRFYTPVTFAGGGTVNNPIFELSTTPAPISGALLVTGPDAIWQGALFSGGVIRNNGALLVERSFISGRVSPRELVNGCELTNAGSMRLRQGFKIQDTARLINSGTITCEQSCAIGRDSGSGTLQNDGTIDVPAGQNLTIASGVVSAGIINSSGYLQLESETDLQGTVRVQGGGTVRLQASATEPVNVGPVHTTGVGNIQLGSGVFQLSGVSVSARGDNGAHGLWFTSATPINIAVDGVYVGDGGLLSWSRGTIIGGGTSSEPHIRVAAGGVLSAIGAPGYPGGGNAHDTFFRVEGNMRQYEPVRLLDESDILVQSGAIYNLTHTSLDGDTTGHLMIDGVLSVNSEGPGVGSSIINVGMSVRSEGFVTVHYNDLVTGATANPAMVHLYDNARVNVTDGARWRAFGETFARNGTPSIGGSGTFELASGGTLSIGDTTLVVDMGIDINSPGQFTQFGTVRADPIAGTGAKFRNDGRWTWRAGGITFPQGAEPTVVNRDSFTADCGQCQLRADFLNQGSAVILDTLVMAEQSVDFINESFLEIRGHIVDATSSHEGRLINRGGGILYKVGATTSQVNTTLDNQNTVLVSQGTLALTGPIAQYSLGELVGGRWEVYAGATLSFAGRAVTFVGPGTEVALNGTWTEFRPQFNRGVLSGTGNVTTPNMINQGIVRPGRSPGTLTVQGNFDQSSVDGVLDMEVAGPVAGTQHDVLAVTGTATLGGTLRVTLLDGYLPGLQEAFTILTASAIQGNFASIEAPSGVQVAVERTATTLRVRISCPADFNSDGAVDFFDYLDFVQAFADSSSAADFNHDAVIDFFDYLDFVQAFSLGC